MLGQTQPHTRLDYNPPRATLITSSLDHPRKTKRVSPQCTSQVVTVPDAKQLVSKLVTSKEQILQRYPDVFEGFGCFSGPLYCIWLDQGITPKQTPCRPIPVHLKEAFQQGIDKMLKAGILKPVHEATVHEATLYVSCMSSCHLTF